MIALEVMPHLSVFLLVCLTLLVHQSVCDSDGFSALLVIAFLPIASRSLFFFLSILFLIC